MVYKLLCLSKVIGIQFVRYFKIEYSLKKITRFNYYINIEIIWIFNTNLNVYNLFINYIF